jgi:hypothetical protein
MKPPAKLCVVVEVNDVSVVDQESISITNFIKNADVNRYAIMIASK